MKIQATQIYQKDLINEIIYVSVVIIFTGIEFLGVGKKIAYKRIVYFFQKNTLCGMPLRLDEKNR